MEPMRVKVRFLASEMPDSNCFVVVFRPINDENAEVLEDFKYFGVQIQEVEGPQTLLKAILLQKPFSESKNDTITALKSIFELILSKISEKVAEIPSKPHDPNEEILMKLENLKFRNTEMPKILKNADLAKQRLQWLKNYFDSHYPKNKSMPSENQGREGVREQVVI